MQAFPEQDHDAHISAHLAYMQSKVAQMQPPVLMTLEKHVYEHLGLKAIVIHDEQMQQDPNAQQGSPEDHEKMIAQIQAQLLTEFQKQQPPAPEQDPLVEVKKQELSLREQEMQMDNQIDQQRLAMDVERTDQTSQIARERIDSQEGIAQMRAQIALQRQQQKQNQGG